MLCLPPSVYVYRICACMNYVGRNAYGDVHVTQTLLTGLLAFKVGIALIYNIRGTQNIAEFFLDVFVTYMTVRVYYGKVYTLLELVLT